MSGHADTFRETVKENLHIYQAQEEAHAAATERALREHAEWKRDHEVYVRAMQALAYGQHVTLTDYGIPPLKVLEKRVDVSGSKA